MRRGPVRFVFQEVVLAVTAEPSDAGGGGLVTIAGSGFDPSAGEDYACLFSSPADGYVGDVGSEGMLSAAVAAQTPAQLVCIVPAWGAERAAGSVAVAVLRVGGGGALVPWAQAIAPEVELVETWMAAGLAGGLALNSSVSAFGACEAPILDGQRCSRPYDIIQFCTGLGVPCELSHMSPFNHSEPVSAAHIYIYIYIICIYIYIYIYVYIICILGDTALMAALLPGLAGCFSDTLATQAGTWSRWPAAASTLGAQPTARSTAASSPWGAAVRTSRRTPTRPGKAAVAWPPRLRLRRQPRASRAERRSGAARTRTPEPAVGRTAALRPSLCTTRPRAGSSLRRPGRRPPLALSAWASARGGGERRRAPWQSAAAGRS
jgi:hypothetical protein